MSVPTVLFVCVHNAGRSQMAAGYLAAIAGERIAVRSAGSEPAEHLNPVAVEAMSEVGIDIAGRTPAVLTPDAVRSADVVITMGCGDACPFFPGTRYEDWVLADPAGQPIEVVRGIRDEIRARVEALVADLLPAPEVLRYTAFSADPDGGNPAGVVLDAGGLDDAAMQRIAAEVDYAETAFVTGRQPDGALRIRYFSPIAEVPFCGHATVATAVALFDRGLAGADGDIRFASPVGPVDIAVVRDSGGARAAFTSVTPTVAPLPDADLDGILDLLGLSVVDLDPALPARLSDAGNHHPVLAVARRDVFDGFAFDPAAVRALMDERGWRATITVIHRTAADRFAARNLFPVGRITEDPATGSAAAAVGAYLRELGVVTVPGRIVIEQGAHVGRPGLLTVDIPASGGIVVSGPAVVIR